MNEQKEYVLQHMQRLWNNWRGSLHKNMKDKPFHDALKDVPKEVDKGDWEWLVKEHFLSDKFKEISTRNSVNRSKLSMPHRTGSKPIRELFMNWEEKMVSHQTWILSSSRHARRIASLSNLKQMQNILRSRNWFNLIHLLQILRSSKSALDFYVRVMWLHLGVG